MSRMHHSLASINKTLQETDFKLKGGSDEGEANYLT